MTLKVGYIPEHFSTPIAFAVKHGFFKKHNCDVELIPYPSGSGHLISSLKEKEIDIAVGLTEAFVRGLCQGDGQYYSIVGEYVESPLCWSISSGAKRDDVTTVSDLKEHNKIGVSRIGSGSYVMSFVLANREKFGKDAFEFEVLQNFKNLRDSVNAGTSDAFMWEYFTTKKYYDNGEIKKIGEIYTPWSSWVVTSRVDDKVSLQTAGFLGAVQEGISYFKAHKEEAVQYILDNLDYEDRSDVNEWYSRVEFSKDVTHVQFEKNIVSTKDVLRNAGIITDREDVVMDRLTAGVPEYTRS